MGFSGLRRELFFLFERTNNIKCITPIRRFESFYHSYAKSRFNTENIDQKTLNELWEHWRHKTIDYLLLKKKYPKKIHFVKFEDLIKNTKKVIDYINNKLDLEFENIQLKPTTLNQNNKGNSSFAKTDNYKGKIFSEPLSNKFDNSIELPNEYKEILNQLENSSSIKMCGISGIINFKSKVNKKVVENQQQNFIQRT